ncbi:hypothetical protein WR25_20902 isoform C [Diploscapter pachys]|uniref:Uncharacterized protein n=1 Tax=Diploscapter pachys TaxID=2018661 RepID=A0A2A2L0C8_9BILA|nr:hypothetical protein WR25_20902 isoform A [Diploscapter pachys]PAV79551.1 hypothetical protein WR25_20902 isoform C [Diploscapter pachys]
MNRPDSLFDPPPSMFPWPEPVPLLYAGQIPSNVSMPMELDDQFDPIPPPCFLLSLPGSSVPGPLPVELPFRTIPPPMQVLFSSNEPPPPYSSPPFTSQAFRLPLPSLFQLQIASPPSANFSLPPPPIPIRLSASPLPRVQDFMDTVQKEQDRGFLPLVPMSPFFDGPSSSQFEQAVPAARGPISTFLPEEILSKELVLNKKTSMKYGRLFLNATDEDMLRGLFEFALFDSQFAINFLMRELLPRLESPFLASLLDMALVDSIIATNAVRSHINRILPFITKLVQLLKLSLEKHGEGDAFMSAALVTGFNQIIHIRIYLQAAIRAFCALIDSEVEDMECYKTAAFNLLQTFCEVSTVHFSKEMDTLEKLYRLGSEEKENRPVENDSGNGNDEEKKKEDEERNQKIKTVEVQILKLYEQVVGVADVIADLKMDRPMYLIVFSTFLLDQLNSLQKWLCSEDGKPNEKSTAVEAEFEQAKEKNEEMARASTSKESEEKFVIWSKAKMGAEAEKAEEKEAEAEKRLLEQSEEMVKWIVWEEKKEPKMPKSEKAKPEENIVQKEEEEVKGENPPEKKMEMEVKTEPEPEQKNDNEESAGCMLVVKTPGQIEQTSNVDLSANCSADEDQPSTSTFVPAPKKVISTIIANKSASLSSSESLEQMNRQLKSVRLNLTQDEGNSPEERRKPERIKEKKSDEDDDSAYAEQRRNFVRHVMDQDNFMQVIYEMDADLARCLTKLFWCNIQLTLKEYHKCARTEEQEKEITKSVNSKFH